MSGNVPVNAITPYQFRNAQGAVLTRALQAVPHYLDSSVVPKVQSARVVISLTAPEIFRTTAGREEKPRCTIFRFRSRSSPCRCGISRPRRAHGIGILRYAYLRIGVSSRAVMAFAL